jgi:hypothetical protein
MTNEIKIKSIFVEKQAGLGLSFGRVVVRFACCGTWQAKRRRGKIY